MGILVRWILVVGLLGYCASLKAQNGSLALGVNGGIGVVDWGNEVTARTFGIRAEYQLLEGVSLSSGLSYKSPVHSILGSADDYVISDLQRLHYLAVPLLARFETSGRWQLTGAIGPFLSYDIREAPFPSNPDFNINQNRVNPGFTGMLGMAYRISDHLALNTGLQVDYGVTDVVNGPVKANTLGRYLQLGIRYKVSS